MIDIIKNQTLHQNFLSLTKIKLEDLPAGLKVFYKGTGVTVPYVATETLSAHDYNPRGNPTSVLSNSSGYLLMLDTLTNELALFKCSPERPVLNIFHVLDYSGRYVTPPSTLSYVPDDLSHRYELVETAEGLIIQFCGADNSIDFGIYTPPDVILTCGDYKFKAISMGHLTDGKDLRWYLLNGYLCIAMDHILWYHCNGAMGELTIEKAIDLRLNPIVGISDINLNHQNRGHYYTHMPTLEPKGPMDNKNQDCYAAPMNGIVHTFLTAGNVLKFN